MDPHELEGLEGDEPDYHPEELEGHEGEMELFIVPPNPPHVRQKTASSKGKKPTSSGRSKNGQSAGQQQPTAEAQQQPTTKAQPQRTASSSNCRRKSKVWLDFTKISKDGDAITIAKCNHCTAELSAKSGHGTSSTGVVLRSDRGVFIAGSCCAISFAEDASSAEARALRDGLILASEVGVQKIIVESDCQDVIDTMLLDGNSLGPTDEECSFLAKNFSLIQFAFCPREANMVAHSLARFAEPTRTIKWMEEPPGFLIDTLANDVSVFSHEI
ncbi:hypothetical protein D1007_26294 [Hordeum vulgare]|nr:hypothetical protein D1007_26294 [Hordeum vulgare]